MDPKELLLQKAKERLAQMKATTADDPVLVPKTYPPELRTPAPVIYQDTKGNPMGVLTTTTKLRFWCALKNGEIHLRDGSTVKFVNHEYSALRTGEIAALRELVKLYPGKFKEL